MDFEEFVYVGLASPLGVKQFFNKTWILIRQNFLIHLHLAWDLVKTFDPESVLSLDRVASKIPMRLLMAKFYLRIGRVGNAGFRLVVVLSTSFVRRGLGRL